ncbi:hypothetical protein JYU34_006744, partial [Plutella xylostella]
EQKVSASGLEQARAAPSEQVDSEPGSRRLLKAAAVMGGEPPTPSHVSIRSRLPSIPPFLFPLPQCSYVSFPLYFLSCAAAERYSAPALTQHLHSAISLAQGAG